MEVTAEFMGSMSKEHRVFLVMVTFVSQAACWCNDCAHSGDAV